MLDDSHSPQNVHAHSTDLQELSNVDDQSLFENLSLLNIGVHM